MPDQRSLTDQLKDLLSVANERGMYDAADYLRTVVEQAEEKSEADRPVPDEDDDGDHLDRKHTGKVRA